MLLRFFTLEYRQLLLLKEIIDETGMGNFMCMTVLKLKGGYRNYVRLKKLVIFFARG